MFVSEKGMNIVRFLFYKNKKENQPTKNVYTLKCTQLAPEYKENKEIIEYEDTLEKYESVTSEEYIRSRKRLTDRICSAALPDRLPYKLCLTCRIETDIFNFAKIMFNEMLAAGIPLVCGT